MRRAGAQPTSVPVMSTRRVWLVTHPKGLVARGADPVLAEDELDALGLDASAGHFVGSLGEASVWVHAIAHDVLPEPWTAVGLRALHGVVDASVFAAAVRAVQIATFADTHRFCGRCATPTRPLEGERALRCPACELTTYPRISPVVIVLVRRGAQALLARSPRFPQPFYSTIAGFVEVGETLEEAIAREVREEVGVEVGALRYFGSQPWPFPHQLMIGFMAEWTAGEIAVDGVEIDEARWFDADALPRVPAPMSIARQLIDAWVREVRAP